MKIHQKINDNLWVEYDESEIPDLDFMHPLWYYSIMTVVIVVMFFVVLFLKSTVPWLNF